MATTAIRTPMRAGHDASRHGIDLGLEPPLARDGGRQPLDRRSVSLRWLSGTILTGLFGAGLIGSAIYVSVDGQFTFAERAVRAVLSLPRTAGPVESERSPRRGDRLFTPVDIVSAKQAFRTPTTIRVGDKEVIKVKPFVRVATNLALASLGYADEVPAFNPLKLYGTDPAVAEKAPEIEPEGDAEVSVRKDPLREGYDVPEAGAALTQEQADAQVADLRRAAQSAASALPATSQGLLTRALMAPKLQGVDPLVPETAPAFSTLQVTFVPENVSRKDKAPRLTPQEGGPEEKVVTIHHGESFEQTLRANGASPFEIRSIQAALGAKAKDVREGERLALLFGLSNDARRPSQLLRVVVYDGEAPVAIAAINDRNDFVGVEPPARGVPADAAEGQDAEDGDGLTLFESLYETGLKHDIPKPVIEQVIRIAFYDVDLQRKVSGGDSFEVFYSEDDENDNRPDLLRATLVVGGQTRNYYRFQLNADGVVDFFDENGRSNRKFLVRKPIAEGELRSTFGMRYHPILRYTRMHTGIDWANKIGTPIFAAGDGKIRSAGWDSGYGRRVEIEHPYNFVTTYSHMSAFAKGIQDGARVRQGQVIGYLGNSGLSTGPHLHYEVMINENFVDPLSVKVPRNRELDQGQLVAFKRERDRIDELIGKAPVATRVAGAR